VTQYDANSVELSLRARVEEFLRNWRHEASLRHSMARASVHTQARAQTSAINRQSDWGAISSRLCGALCTGARARIGARAVGGLMRSEITVHGGVRFFATLLGNRRAPLTRLRVSPVQAVEAREPVRTAAKALRDLACTYRRAMPQVACGARHLVTTAAGGRLGA
jgi:hypothetical protein